MRWSPISNRKAVIYSRMAKAQEFSFLFFAFPFLTSLLLYLVSGGAMAYGMTKFGTHSLNWRYPSLEEGRAEKAMAPKVQKAQRKLPSTVLAFFFFWSSLPRGWLFFFFWSTLFQVVTLTNLHWFLYPCHLKTTLLANGELFLYARPAALSNVTSVCSH